MRAIVGLALLVGTAAYAGDAGDGRAVYVAKCLACHGQDGKGNGPAAAALPKHPPDFTSSDFWGSRSDAQIKATISGGKPEGVMRPFPMKDQQMDDLVAYLHTFADHTAKAPSK